MLFNIITTCLALQLDSVQYVILRWLQNTFLISIKRQATNAKLTRKSAMKFPTE